MKKGQDFSHPFCYDKGLNCFAIYIKSKTANTAL